MHIHMHMCYAHLDSLDSLVNNKPNVHIKDHICALIDI